MKHIVIQCAWDRAFPKLDAGDKHSASRERWDVCGRWRFESYLMPKVTPRWVSIMSPACIITKLSIAPNPTC